MKKFLAMVISLCLLAAFAACQGDTPSAQSNPSDSFRVGYGNVNNWSQFPGELSHETYVELGTQLVQERTKVLFNQSNVIVDIVS